MLDEVRRKTKIRCRKILAEAAERTLNGNGASANLPPLPHCTGDEDESDGLGCLFSHPYGALPYGNIYMVESGLRDKVRKNGLGMLQHMNDDQVLTILSFCCGQTLSRITQCSRFLYVAGHHDELWRDLTLRRASKVDFMQTWKDTFVSTQLGDDRADECIPHQPISMNGIYSDIFFRSWLCRSFALQKSWLDVESVPKVEKSELSLLAFLQEYEEKNQPVIIKNATCEWPALKKWKDREYLIKQTEGLTFRATSGAAPLPAEFSMKSYSNYCESTVEEAPLYLFDRSFVDKCPQLLDDYYDSLKETCPFFDDEADHGTDLLSLLGKNKRPDHRWIIMGPKRSGSSFHIDPNGTHAWNAPIVGRKRWIFYPPGVNPPGVFPSKSGDDVAMPISLGEWFLSYWNDHVMQRTNQDPSKRPLECTVEPNDILFVPHGWWHCVMNLDSGVSIALTQNYVSASNLSDVLRFLKMKPQQISGCRDRVDAIQPDSLLQSFTASLKHSRPDLLVTAQKLADKGWNCPAWQDEDIQVQAQSVPRKKQKVAGCSIVERARKDTSTLIDTTGFQFGFYDTNDS